MPEPEPDDPCDTAALLDAVIEPAVLVDDQGRVLRCNATAAARFALDPDAHPESRLGNLIMQRRARWLLAHTDDLFLSAPPAPEKP